MKTAMLALGFVGMANAANITQFSDYSTWLSSAEAIAGSSFVLDTENFANNQLNVPGLSLEIRTPGGDFPADLWNYIADDQFTFQTGQHVGPIYASDADFFTIPGSMVGFGLYLTTTNLNLNVLLTDGTSEDYQIGDYSGFLGFTAPVSDVQGFELLDGYGTIAEIPLADPQFATPEPATWLFALLGIGLLALGLRIPGRTRGKSADR